MRLAWNRAGGSVVRWGVGTTTEPAPPELSDAVEAAYRRVWPDVVRLGHLLTGSRALGEELAQEAFLGMLRRAEPPENPAAYARRAVANLAINHGRRQKHERAYVARLTEETVLPPDVDETWQVVRKLPPRQRAVLVLRYYADLSEAEIAATLGCRPGTVKSLASRGLARLKEELT
jgi:RNA polymerase sigma factor (sigma-70 family)